MPMRFRRCGRMPVVPNPLLTSDVDAFMNVGEVDLTVVRELWPAFSCREPGIFLNPKVIWRHMESRDDFALRLKVFNTLGPFVPDIVNAPHVTARYASVPGGHAGINLACPLEGFDGLGDHVVVCVRMLPPEEVRAGRRHYVATIFPWHERRRTSYLLKNDHRVHDRHCVVTPQGARVLTDTA